MHPLGALLVSAALVARLSPPHASLQALVPVTSRAALEAALKARENALRSGAVRRTDLLTVIDYSRPSTEPRLFVIDIAANRLRFAERVAHGRGSGENETVRFSNREGSHMTSLGVFRAAEGYVGQHGVSLRLDGLEPGFNDRARGRDIVVHGAGYVNPTIVASQGRLGRSWGCPAVRPEIARELIETIQDGSLVVAYYPDADWLARSEFLKGPERAAEDPS